MWFWIMMFICNLLMPVLMLAAGYMMDRHTPKKINGIYGYRTARSMKNMETWNYAHHYFGKLWMRCGALTLAPSVLVQLPFIHSTENCIGIVTTIITAIQLVVLMIPVFLTEKALRRKFG